MMENELPTRPAPATGSETIDAEHGIQLGLVEASLSALSSEADDASALVEQLFTWTEAHFLYEQLLMRRAAQPQYEGHVQEHNRLLQQLQTIRDRARKTDFAEAVVELRAHEEDLIEHIRTWDMSIE
jgi:hemerythrin-like metal-binding protein